MKIKFDDFVKLQKLEDFKQFNYTTKENLNEFQFFLDIINGNDTHWHYTENFIMNDMSSNGSKFKHAIIQMDDGDEVYLHFKIIQLHVTRQIRIINKPISMLNNENNIRKIINFLSTLPYVKATIKENDLYLFENWKVEKTKEETEHYSNLKKWKEKYNTNKWITKRRIKWTLEDDNFIFRLATEKDIDDILNFFESWAEYKTLKNTTVSNKKSYKTMINSIGKRNDILFHIMTYKNKVVGVLGYTIYKNTVNQIINMSASRTTIEYDSEKVRKIFFDLTKQMTWFSYLDLYNNHNIEFVYCGDGTDSKGAETYKKQCNTDCIYYSKISPNKK